jgi:hypothetical protein
MNDVMTKIAAILWADGPNTEWNADTTSAIAEVVRAAGYGPSAAPAPAPAPTPIKATRTRGRGVTFSAAVAALAKLLPKASKVAAWQTMLVEPSGVRLLPSAGESYAIVAETGLTEAVAVDGKLFAGALKGIDTPALSIRGNALIVSGGGLEVSVPILRDMTEPGGAWRLCDLPEPDLSGAVTWYPNVMQEIAQVARVASRDASRHAINRVLVEPEAVVATDGHRMEVRYVSTHLLTRFVLPQDAINLLVSTKECVHVAVKGGSVWLHSGLYTVRVPNSDEFPSWRHVLPKSDDFEYEVYVIKDALRDFCKRVPKAEAGKQPIIMTVIPGDNIVRFEWGGGAMRSEDIASHYNKVKQTTRIGLNASYLLDLLDGLPEGACFDLLTYGDMAPMAVRGQWFLHVLMPCRA